MTLIIHDQLQMSAEDPIGASVRGYGPRQALAVGQGRNTVVPVDQLWNALFVASPADLWTRLRPVSKLGRGNRVPVLSHSHRLVSSSPSRRPALYSLPWGVGQNSGVLRDNSARRRFSFRAADGCTRRAQSTPHQVHGQSTGAVVAHRLRLSKFVLPSEAHHDGKGFGRVPKSKRAFHKKEGELPNVGC